MSFSRSLRLCACPVTLPETNIAPENGWLEDEFPFGKVYFQVLCFSCREGIRELHSYDWGNLFFFSLHQKAAGSCKFNVESAVG